MVVQPITIGRSFNTFFHDILSWCDEDRWCVFENRDVLNLCSLIFKGICRQPSALDRVAALDGGQDFIRIGDLGILVAIVLDFSELVIARRKHRDHITIDGGNIVEGCTPQAIQCEIGRNLRPNRCGIVHNGDELFKRGAVPAGVMRDVLNPMILGSPRRNRFTRHIHMTQRAVVIGNDGADRMKIFVGASPCIPNIATECDSDIA